MPIRHEVVLSDYALALTIMRRSVLQTLQQYGQRIQLQLRILCNRRCIALQRGSGPIGTPLQRWLRQDRMRSQVLYAPESPQVRHGASVGGPYLLKEKY